MIDTCLGVEHSQREGEFLRRMRQYMPPNQREMLEELSKLPSMRSVCQGREELERKYNLCLSSLERLRTEHLILVSRYITSQVRRRRGPCTDWTVCRPTWTGAGLDTCRNKELAALHSPPSSNGSDRTRRT